MKKLKVVLLQAIAITALGFLVAFVHNAFSGNGINPFRRVAEVPIAVGEKADGREGIRIVHLEETRNLMAGGAKVLDARPEEEFAEGHIPGAMLFDYYELGRYMEEVLPLLSREERIVVYCSGRECDDAELLARELYTLGFTRLYVYKGGYEGWLDSGLPVEKDGNL